MDVDDNDLEDNINEKLDNLNIDAVNDLLVPVKSNDDNEEQDYDDDDEECSSEEEDGNY